MLQREVAIFYLLRDLNEEFKKGEIRLYVLVNIRNALLQITHCCLPPGSLSYFIDWPRRFLEWRHCSNETFSWREGREDRYHFCGLGELDMLQTAEQRLRRLKHRTINYHTRNMVTNMKVFSCSSTTSWKQKVPFHSLFVSCEEGEVKWNRISKSLKIPFPKLSRVRVGRQCRHEHVCNGATTRWSLFCWGSFYERGIFTQRHKFTRSARMSSLCKLARCTCQANRCMKILIQWNKPSICTWFQ